MPTPAAFIEKLMNRALQAGIPLWRVYIGLQLIHPQMQAMGFMWRRGEKVQQIARAYGIQFTPSYIGSPLQEVREQGRPVRYRMKDVGEDHHVALRDVKADGGTDYFATPMSIRRDGPAPVVTFATDSRTGFSDDDITDLTRLVDMMGAVIEMHIERSIAETVANTYLGRQVGQRILNGAIRRGEGEEIRAVLWFSDLRDFTGMNERLEASEVLELLNNYLQLVGDALGAHGGEILKFIGDGVMGYFPAEDALFLPMVTGAALNAARRLIERHRSGQRGARHRRQRTGAVRHRPACRRGDLRQCRHRGPARLHRHRSRRQPGGAAGEPDQGAQGAGAGLGRFQGGLHPAAGLAGLPSPARHRRSGRGLHPAELVDQVLPALDPGERFFVGQRLAGRVDLQPLADLAGAT